MELLKTDLLQGDPPVLQIDGEIDVSTIEQLRLALEEARSNDPRFVVDMAGVTFFDATGVRVLLQAAAARNGAGPLVLLNASQVSRVLEWVGLNDLTSISMPEAVDARDG